MDRVASWMLAYDLDATQNTLSEFVLFAWHGSEDSNFCDHGESPFLVTWYHAMQDVCFCRGGNSTVPMSVMVRPDLVLQVCEFRPDSSHRSFQARLHRFLESPGAFGPY